MLHIERFVNQLMSSNCYIVVDEDSKHCFCIDPASENSEREIEYIEQNGLTLDYIFLTHEHTDHTWGVNSILNQFPTAKVVCSSLCRDALPKEARTYFQLYYDDPSYVYRVERVDYTTEELGWHLTWQGHQIVFIATPGHSPGSVCISIEGILFGGDTLMPFKPFIKKRNGGSIEDYRKSLLSLQSQFKPSTIVYSGHGESMNIKEMLGYFCDIIES